MSKDNGGPAFPCKQKQMFRVTTRTSDGFEERNCDMPGMSLRDYFAAKALQGLASKEGSSDFHYEAMAAYKYADAMLAARDA